jgi:uncharacterized membrane protein YsdA (DUF1294 family)
MQHFPQIGAGAIAVFLLCVNAFAYGAFAFDKQAAREGRRRVSEANLLFLATVGGAIGALAGMYGHRHKTKKPLFRFGLPLILTAQLFALAYFWFSGTA